MKVAVAVFLGALAAPPETCGFVFRPAPPRTPSTISDGLSRKKTKSVLVESHRRALVTRQTVSTLWATEQDTATTERLPEPQFITILTVSLKDHRLQCIAARESCRGALVKRSEKRRWFMCSLSYRLLYLFFTNTTGNKLLISYRNCTVSIYPVILELESILRVTIILYCWYLCAVLLSSTVRSVL